MHSTQKMNENTRYVSRWSRWPLSIIIYADFYPIGLQVYVLEVEELSVPSPITTEEKEDQREDENNAVVVGSGKKWKVYRRFSQFKELHTKVIILVVPKK